MTIVVLFTSLLMIFVTKNLQYDKSISQPDVWENHTVAANFALYNKFPIMGMIGDRDLYQLDKLEGNNIQSYSKCRFLEAGPVVDFFKPPVYGLILGVGYKLLGVDLMIPYYLNVFFLLGIVFFMTKATCLMNSKSWIGGIAALFYMYFGVHNLNNILPETLVTLLLLIVVYIAILILKTNKTSFYFLIGIVIGLGVLTKGTMLILSLLIICSIIVSKWKTEKLLIKICSLIGGLLIILSPWIIYSNVLRLNTSAEMIKWRENVVSTEKKCDHLLVEGEWAKTGIGFSANAHHEKLVTDLLKRYVTPHSVIIISNQTPAEGLLELHNEYCIDGLWHPEWKFEDDAIYNNHYTSFSPVGKVIRFYVDNPRYIYKNALGKLKSSINSSNYIFILSAFLISCLSIISRVNRTNYYVRPVLFIVFVLAYWLTSLISFDLHLSLVVFTTFIGLITFTKKNSALHLLTLLTVIGVFVTLFLFYGAPRFVNFTLPTMLIFLTSTTIMLGKELFKKNYGNK